MNKEIFGRLSLIINEWLGKENYRVPAHSITQMFNIHNEIFPQNLEYSTSCGGCRERVWNRIKGYYLENKHLYES